MLEELIARLRSLDLLNLQDDALDEWADNADDALRDATDALEELHKTVLVISEKARAVLTRHA